MLNFSFLFAILSLKGVEKDLNLCYNAFMKKIIIYTDGACSVNPGKGGWCAILKYSVYEKVLSGGEKETTNNRMELSAVCFGLSALKEPCEVELYSDSAYVVNALTEGWLEGWQRKGWKKADGKPVMNVDLWQELLRLLSIHKVHFNKVKGHSDNELNNRCDEIARQEVLKQ